MKLLVITMVMVMAMTILSVVAVSSTFAYAYAKSSSGGSGSSTQCKNSIAMTKETVGSCATECNIVAPQGGDKWVECMTSCLNRGASTAAVTPKGNDVASMQFGTGRSNTPSHTPKGNESAGIAVSDPGAEGPKVVKPHK